MSNTKMAGKVPAIRMRFPAHRRPKSSVLIGRLRIGHDYVLLGSFGRSFAAWPRYPGFPRLARLFGFAGLLRYPGLARHLSFRRRRRFPGFCCLARFAIAVAVIAGFEVRAAAAATARAPVAALLAVFAVQAT